MKKSMGIVVLIWIFVLNLSAGWQIKMSDDGRIQEIYFDGHKMALKDNQMHMIMDVKSGDMHILNPVQKKYWGGNINEFAEMIEQSVSESKKMMDSQMEMMKQQMKNMPPQQQEMMKKMFAMQEEKDSAPVKLKIEKAGSESVNGITCDKYEIYVNGELTEKIWLSEDLPFYDDFKEGEFQKEMLKMQAKFEKIAGDINYKTNQSYMELVSSKIVVKAMRKEAAMMGGGGGWSTTEYVSSKEMDVDKFIRLPKGYTQAPLMEVMNPQSKPMPGQMK